MPPRFAITVASTAASVLLLTACSDDGDGPTTLAEGEDIEFVGTDGLGEQTMQISAREDDDEISGEVSFDPNGIVTSVECADTEGDDHIILGTQATTASRDGDEPVGTWMAVLIREGDPDAVTLWYAEDSDTCEALLDEAREASHPDNVWADVESGDIETG